MSDPLVSVVITAYQAARWLPDTLASVMAQTYERWEVLLIDDGSTDDTVDRIAPFMSRIHYTHQPNAGLAAARNAGLALIGGDYVALLDADDVWTREKLATQIAVATAHPDSGLIVCDGVAFDDATGRVLKPHLIRDRSVRSELADAPDGTVTGQFHHRVIEQNPIAVPAQTLIGRRALEQVGPFGDFFAQDYDYWLRISQQFPITFHADDLVRRRVHAESMSSSSTRPRFELTAERVAILRRHRSRCDARARSVVDKRRRALVRRASKSLVGYGLRRDRRAARRWLSELARVDPWSLFPRAALALLRVMPGAPKGDPPNHD